MNVGDTLYRWDSYLTEDGSSIFLTEHRVIRLTPKGFYFTDGGGEKWTSVHWHKQYVHSSREEALEAFIARRKRWKHLLEVRLERCMRELTAAQKHLQTGELPCRTHAVRPLITLSSFGTRR